MISPHKNIQCSMCGKYVLMTRKNFRRNLEIHNAHDEDSLSAVYLCRVCRTGLNKVYSIPLIRTDRYYKILKALREAAKDFEIRGPNKPEVVNNFRKSVEAILLKEHIDLKNYSVLIVNGAVKGFKLTNIPIFGTIILPLKKRKNEF